MGLRLDADTPEWKEFVARSQGIHKAGASSPIDPQLKRLREIASRLISPHADKVYIAKDYTKADLRIDILKAIGEEA